MMSNYRLALLIAALLCGCTSAPTRPLELSAEPVTQDGLHKVEGDRDYVLYFSPLFAERARAGVYRGKGLYLRSCTVTFADSDQEALFSELRDRMQDYLCETIKNKLDQRGVARIEEGEVVPETRIVDLWLLHVTMEVPEVAGASTTAFVFSGSSEEMTFGWVSTEAGTGLPILRYYQRGRFSHSGPYLGARSEPSWRDLRREIDLLADNALASFVPAVGGVTRQPPPVPPTK